MIDIKRRYIYSALALPFVCFGVYAATLSPVDRATFFTEFKHKTSNLFGGESENELQGLRTTGEYAAEYAAPEGAGDENSGRGENGRGGFDPTAMFERFDEDDDGKLTGDEIRERMRENLEQIDINQDGSVSLEEFQQRIQQMRANRDAANSPEESSDGDANDGESAQPSAYE